MRSTLRAMIVAAALGAPVAPHLAAIVLPVQAQQAPTAVSIDNFTFSPQTVTVKAGTTVTWTNKDDIPHGIAWVKNAFTKTKALDTDDSFSFTFTTPGSYAYFLASVVYRRRQHVINLFVAQQLGATVHGEKRETVHGFNVRHWTEGGLDFWAVSDINAGELDEFCQKLTAALHPPPRLRDWFPRSLPGKPKPIRRIERAARDGQTETRWARRTFIPIWISAPITNAARTPRRAV